MSITLVTIGTTNHSLTKFSIEKTLHAIPNITKVKVFSDRNLGIGEFHQLPTNFSLYDYSIFAMKELNQYIDTDHVIMCHYDGIGVNREYWDDKFLQYDYIGSATHKEYEPMKSTLQAAHLTKYLKQPWYSLGGGFCLRSKKLLEALQDSKIETTFYNHIENTLHSCEDISIGILYKELLEKKYDIKFGSFEDSVQFASEILNGYNHCIGFHGWHLVPFFFDENESYYYIEEYIQSNGDHNVNIKKLKKFVGNCYTQNYDNIIKYLKSIYKFL